MAAGVGLMSVLGAGANLAGGLMGASAAKKAAKAQAATAMEALKFHKAAYNETKENTQDYRNAGAEGVNLLSALLQDPNAIQDSAAYQFRRNEGLEALDRAALARGNAFSGAQAKGLQDYASGLASQEYGNQFQRLFNTAGMGLNATNTLANVATSTATNMGNLLQDAANYKAQGMANSGNALMSGLGGARPYMGEAIPYIQKLFGGQSKDPYTTHSGGVGNTAGGAFNAIFRTA